MDLTKALIENIRKGSEEEIKIRIADVMGVKYLIEVFWRGEWYEIGELDQGFVELKLGSY